MKLKFLIFPLLRNRFYQYLCYGTGRTVASAALPAMPPTRKRQKAAPGKTNAATPVASRVRGYTWQIIVPVPVGLSDACKGKLEFDTDAAHSDADIGTQGSAPLPSARFGHGQFWL